jgi:hypothetical protein
MKWPEYITPTPISPCLPEAAHPHKRCRARAIPVFILLDALRLRPAITLQMPNLVPLVSLSLIDSATVAARIPKDASYIPDLTRHVGRQQLLAKTHNLCCTRLPAR